MRSVHEEKAEYVVTVRGKAVAILRPFTEEDARRLRLAEVGEELAAMKGLAEKVASSWSSQKSAADLIAEQRR